MKYFNKKLGDNDSKAWKPIVKLFNPGKDVKGNENFLGIDKIITRARNDYDTAKRQALYKLVESPQLDTIKDQE